MGSGRMQWEARRGGSIMSGLKFGAAPYECLLAALQQCV